LDVWVRLYVAWKRGEWAKETIENTPMEMFFKLKTNRFEYLFNVLMQKQAGYDTPQWFASTNNYWCPENGFVSPDSRV